MLPACGAAATPTSTIGTKGAAATPQCAPRHPPRRGPPMRRLLPSLLLALCTLASAAQAQIRIGQTAGIHRPGGGRCEGRPSGARCWYIDAVNAAGGVNGQKHRTARHAGRQVRPQAGRRERAQVDRDHKAVACATAGPVRARTPCASISSRWPPAEPVPARPQRLRQEHAAGLLAGVLLAAAGRCGARQRLGEAGAARARPPSAPTMSATCSSSSTCCPT
jgi:hypothetical protein